MWDGTLFRGKFLLLFFLSSSGLGLQGIKKSILFCGPFGSLTDLNFKICMKNGAIFCSIHYNR